ncbi:Wax synthase [Parasponia andersonii]|uniref:Wax synthase n=1 Tax=Parasponia andersonii TaxID=3476 RepID=A0A2P5A921_PARAD|nr:Wax synthase [Parasponia andersonii]
MEGEIITFGKVWLSAYASLSYCYVMAKFVPKGLPRLAAFIPVVFFFLYLPLNLSSVHLGGTTAFFLAWLANFKLLLFAFAKGPLSADPSSSLPRFLALACLPIQNSQNAPPPLPGSKSPRKSHLNYALKGLLLGLLVRAHDYSESMHPRLILVLYSFHIYLCLEIILAVAAALARAVLGLELEPQFDEPYLATSLQDFWGRRWNIMVTRILRPTVYEPVLRAAARVMGRRWAPLPAVMGTFAVSAAMHELIFYYLGRLRPSWEITWFFVLHGACLTVEIGLKRALTGRFRLPRAVSGPLTVGFVMVTGFWLFFPPLLRFKADVRAFEEYAAVGAFVMNVGSTALNLKTIINATDPVLRSLQFYKYNFTNISV